MFKLPVCPYCHTVYSYDDVRKNRKKKSIKCYHCNKEFIQSKIKGFTYLIILITFTAVIINVLILSLMSDIINSAVPIFVVSVFEVILAFILTPFFTTYKVKKK